ncbi:MAG: hypothetical protein M3P96_14690 [Actinomycetota bacterium]|nr:hypothetical protein [Actinomycetota bacterium]
MQGYLAAGQRRLVAGSVRVAVDEESFAGGFDDFLGDVVEGVDLEDALDLAEQAVDEAEVAAGDAGDGGDRDGLGELVAAAGHALGVPAVGEDRGEFLGRERAVLVGEADAAVQLGVAG